MGGDKVSQYRENISILWRRLSLIFAFSLAPPISPLYTHYRRHRLVRSAYVCMYTHRRATLCLFECIYNVLSACMHVCMYIHMYTYICIYIYIYIYTSARVRAHAHTHKHTHTCICVYIYAYHRCYRFSHPARSRWTPSPFGTEWEVVVWKGHA